MREDVTYVTSSLIGSDLAQPYTIGNKLWLLMSLLASNMYKFHTVWYNSANQYGEVETSSNSYTFCKYKSENNLIGIFCVVHPKNYVQGLCFVAFCYGFGMGD